MLENNWFGCGGVQSEAVVVWRKCHFSDSVPAMGSVLAQLVVELFQVVQLFIDGIVWAPACDELKEFEETWLVESSFALWYLCITEKQTTLHTPYNSETNK